MSEFDVNGYNSHECDIHNHGYYLGAQSQQAKIDELEFKLSSTVNNFDNLCKTIAIHQKFLDDADVANKFLTDEVDELQARIDSLTNINESLVAYKNQLLDEIEEKGNKDEN